MELDLPHDEVRVRVEHAGEALACPECGKARPGNALAESINGRIQRVKRLACDFRNTDRFQRAICFHLGDLDLHPASATHTGV